MKKNRNFIFNSNKKECKNNIQNKSKLDEKESETSSNSNKKEN